MVYATFTDVVVVKLSKRLIRFVPAATTLAEPGSTGGGAASADGSGQAGAGTSDAGARCQVGLGCGLRVGRVVVGPWRLFADRACSGTLTSITVRHSHIAPLLPRDTT